MSSPARHHHSVMPRLDSSTVFHGVTLRRSGLALPSADHRSPASSRPLRAVRAASRPPDPTAGFSDPSSARVRSLRLQAQAMMIPITAPASSRTGIESAQWLDGGFAPRVRPVRQCATVQAAGPAPARTRPAARTPPAASSRHTGREIKPQPVSPGNAGPSVVIRKTSPLTLSWSTM